MFLEPKELPNSEFSIIVPSPQSLSKKGSWGRRGSAVGARRAWAPCRRGWTRWAWMKLARLGGAGAAFAWVADVRQRAAGAMGVGSAVARSGRARGEDWAGRTGNPTISLGNELYRFRGVMNHTRMAWNCLPFGALVMTGVGCDLKIWRGGPEPLQRHQEVSRGIPLSRAIAQGGPHPVTLGRMALEEAGVGGALSTIPCADERGRSTGRPGPGGAA